MRVIADHLRAMTFLIADGVVPSNEWRGYVLRKIMRRAMRHGKKLGFTEPVLHTLVDVVVARDGRRLPRARQPTATTIVRMVRSEEERFDAVLTAGLPRLEEALDRAAAGGARRAPATRRSGSTTRSACRSTSWRTSPASAASRIDREGFERAMEGQRDARARRQLVQGGREGPDDRRCRRSSSARSTSAGDEFDGLRRRRCVDGRAGDRRVRRRAARWIDELRDGRTRATSRSPRTPFYLEAGGQVSDQGGCSAPTAPRRVVRADGALCAGPAAAAPRARDERRVPRATDRHGGGGRRRCATRRGATTPRRTCCTRRCGRCSART